MTVKTVIAPTDIGAGLKISGAKVIIDSGYFAPETMIRRSSKIGLKATLVANATAILTLNAPLTYAWTGAGVTFGTASAATTTVVATTPGEYSVTCTVTDADGQAFVETHRLKLDRVLEVGGADGEVNDRLATLQAAFNWINTNDGANASSYLIVVVGVTSDASRIVPNGARVHFQSGGQIPVGVDFPAGTFYWSGAGKEWIAINAGSGAGIAFSAVATLYLQNVGVKAVGTGSASALRTGVITGCTVNLQDCYFETANGSCVSLGGGTFNVKGCYCVAVAGGQAFACGTATVYIDGLEARAGMGYSAVYLPDVTGVVSGVRAFASTNGSTVVRTFHINMLATDGLTLVVKDCLAVLTGATSAAAIASAFLFEGTGNRQVYLVNCTGFAVAAWALIRLSTAAAGNWNVINCVLVGANAGAVLSNLNATTLATTAWNPARIYNTVFRGTLSGPITFTAGTVQTGENIIM